MQAPPTGTVTFLFTDIQGSTSLWESAPDAMRPALVRHDDLLRDAIETSGGYVFKTVGDAFCAAFPTASLALEAALDAQLAIAAEAWELPTPLAVRMALHTGACEERDGDYFGQPLNRVARLIAAGHGSQVLLSDVTQGLVRDVLPPSASLRDLGQHRLKDLGRPEQVFQLLCPGLAAEFPPLCYFAAQFSIDLTIVREVASTSVIGHDHVDVSFAIAALNDYLVRPLDTLAVFE